jgi:hypothetical protein
MYSTIKSYAVEMIQHAVSIVTSDYKNVNKLVICTCSQQVVFFGMKSLFVMNK